MENVSGLEEFEAGRDLHWESLVKPSSVRDMFNSDAAFVLKQDWQSFWELYLEFGSSSDLCLVTLRGDCIAEVVILTRGVLGSETGVGGTRSLWVTVLATKSSVLEFLGPPWSIPWFVTGDTAFSTTAAAAFGSTSVEFDCPGISDRVENWSDHLSKMSCIPGLMWNDELFNWLLSAETLDWGSLLWDTCSSGTISSV